MSTRPFKLGLVGLCTSHPEAWVPIIRTLNEERLVDVEVAAAWDSGETRPAGFAQEFARKFDIAKSPVNLEDMLNMVDGVIVHTTNWDKHLEQARPFVDAGKAVLLDKPMVGTMSDINQLLDWGKTGKRVTGGSSLRFTTVGKEYLARPVKERGTIHTLFAGCGVDEFNYGIHAYAFTSQLMGAGIQSVQWLGTSLQKQIKISWKDGRVAILAVGSVGGGWLPFHLTAITEKNVAQLVPDNSSLYRPLLEACLPYMAGQTDEAPLAMTELVEPEMAALAARQSWLNGGKTIYLSDLKHNDEGYDGTQFAREYRRARLSK